MDYTKTHNRKELFCSFEHMLFSYTTAVRIKGESFDVYYALTEWERISHCICFSYAKSGAVKELSDENVPYRVTFNELH